MLEFREIEMPEGITAGDYLDLIRLTCEAAGLRAMGDLQAAERVRAVRQDIATIRQRYA